MGLAFFSEILDDLETVLFSRSMLFDATAFWLYDNRESLMIDQAERGEGPTFKLTACVVGAFGPWDMIVQRIDTFFLLMPKLPKIIPGRHRKKLYSIPCWWFQVMVVNHCNDRLKGRLNSSWDGFKPTK